MSFDFDDFDVRTRFTDLDDKTDELVALLNDMPEEVEAFDEKCKIAYIYHDCALDGIVLTYHELRAAVDRKVMSDAALIPTYQEIKNHCDALERFMAQSQVEQSTKSRSQAPRITVQQIHELHILLNKDLPRKTPGVLRKDMPLHRTYFHDLYEPADIEGGLHALCELVNQSDFRSQHAINQACIFHHRFMHILPFSDGAGKIGRLLMNYFLMRAGYRPAVIHACDRQRYYEALRGGPEAIRGLLLDSMDAAMETSLRHLKERLSARRHHNRRQMSG